MISRCPSCGAPAPDEARQCRACGWDFVANKLGDKAAPEKPKPAAPHSAPPAGGLSLPPARGGGAEVPAQGLGMARLPKVEPAGFAAPGAPEENPFALPVARNLGQKPGESLFAPPPNTAEPKLPDARPKEPEPLKEPAPPRQIDPPKIDPPKIDPPKVEPSKVEPPKRAPLEPPKEERSEAAGEEADDEPSPALFLPSSTKEIVVETPSKPVKPPPRAEPREPEPESIFAKPASAGSIPSPAKPETAGSAKPAGRQSAVYLAALAGGALGLFSIGALFMMLRPDPQGAVRPTGSSPFGKRSSGDATMTPVLDEPLTQAPIPVPAPPSPAPVMTSDDPPPTSLPAPVVSRPVVPPSPASAPVPKRPERATATFAQPARPRQAAKPPPPPAAPKKAPGPQWLFEGAVYDLLSTRGVYGVKLLFLDADDNEVAFVETGEGGNYRASMKAGPSEGYALRIVHDDYSGKHIDELDSTSSVRKADLEQRKFLMQAGARSLPWIGAVGKTVRRDMALVPKVGAE